MKLDLEDLKAKAKAATPGPWEYKQDEGLSVIFSSVGTQEAPWLFRGGDYEEYNEADVDDYRFIAAANPQVVLEMIDMLEMLANVSDLAIEVCERAVAKGVEINPSTLLSAIGSVVFELNERTKKYKAKK